MFGDLFGNVQKQQEELAEKLASITVEADAGDGAVQVTATCDQTIKNIALDPAKLDFSDLEMIEDLVLTAVNAALEKAKNKAAAESHKLLKNMMPPGMDGLFGK